MQAKPTDVEKPSHKIHCTQDLPKPQSSFNRMVFYTKNLVNYGTRVPFFMVLCPGWFRPPKQPPSLRGTTSPSYLAEWPLPLRSHLLVGSSRFFHLFYGFLGGSHLGPLFAYGQSSALDWANLPQGLTSPSGKISKSVCIHQGSQRVPFGDLEVLKTRHTTPGWNPEHTIFHSPNLLKRSKEAAEPTKIRRHSTRNQGLATLGLDSFRLPASCLWPFSGPKVVGTFMKVDDQIDVYMYNHVHID